MIRSTLTTCLRHGLVALAAVAVSTSVAAAAVVTYDLEQRFNGTSNLYGPGPSPTGALLTGSITFDTTAQTVLAFDISTPGVGRVNTYVSTDALTSFTTRTFGSNIGLPSETLFFRVSITSLYGPILSYPGTIPVNATDGTSSNQFKADLGLTFINPWTAPETMSFNQGESVLEFTRNS